MVELGSHYVSHDGCVALDSRGDHDAQRQNRRRSPTKACRWRKVSGGPNFATSAGEGRTGVPRVARRADGSAWPGSAPWKPRVRAVNVSSTVSAPVLVFLHRPRHRCRCCPAAANSKLAPEAEPGSTAAWLLRVIAFIPARGDLHPKVTVISGLSAAALWAS